MKFLETAIPGVLEIHIEPKADERGFFARTWCSAEFEAQGLRGRLDQCSLSFNAHKGTLRGLHWQEAPFAETKIVRCTGGSVFDVAVDLRPSSPTYLQWIAVVLSAIQHNMLYIPEGCGHGFLTLEDKTEVFYQMTGAHQPDAARGARWDDRVFGIRWPTEVQIISERDRSFPDFIPNRSKF